MIYRPGINCGYLRLPEVVTPYMRTARGRDRGEEEWRGLEKSGGIHSYDRQRRQRLCIFTRMHMHTCTEKGVGRGAVYKFLRFPMKLRSLETRGADLSPDPSHAAAFAESLSFYFLFFFSFSILSHSLFFCTLRTSRKLNKSRAFCYTRRRPSDGLAVLFAPYGSKYSGGLF